MVPHESGPLRSGQSSPATTLRYYASWTSGKGKRWVNILDRRADRKGAQDGLVVTIDRR